MRQRLLIANALLAATLLPAQAMTITARVSGGNIAIHAGPSDRYELVGRVADGTEIPIDQCTQSDSDSRRGSWIGDAGYSLRGSDATLWCHIPDTGWVMRSNIVGRGLVNVTPPDFDGPGW
ncbi:SH3 domain-containing protein [Devosia beringensis]|uniref:hypothetical protein n=1 Tax=Devosia beringensis TaxID=2657486 RepID=UPI00186B6A20|nr:hypothetical protein [Devosia beringensis]